MNAEEISSTNFIESQLREFYTKNKQGKGEGFGRRLLELYRKAYASKDNFFCEEQVNGYEKCETQCDYCRDKPKIQKA